MGLRRHFLQLTGYLIPRTLIILFLFNSFLFGANISVYEKMSQNYMGEIESIKAGRYNFISLESFAQTLNISYSINKQKKQFTFNIPNNPVTLTAINPFVKIGSDIRQMPINVLYQKGKYYAPLAFFLDTVGDNLPFEPFLQNDKLYIAFGNNNISSISIEEKINGFVLRISATKPFKQNDIFTNQTNNWFYIDIYGGIVDTLNTLPIINSGKKIRQVVTHQLSAETARLGFQTYLKIIKTDILESENPKEIIVALRTQESISADLLQELEREREKWKIDVIVLDPGHGGKDPGAIGRSGLYEKKVALAIAKEAKKEIEKRMDVKVILTRDRDKFVPLKKRTDIANKAGGKLFISIHADSNPVRRLKGHTVYFLGPAKTKEARQAAQYENSVIKFEDSQNHYKDISDASFILAANAQNAYNKESQDFASILNTKLKHEVSNNGYGVKQGVFYVLHGASMPNVVLETAFISNRNDEKKLRDRNFYKKVAKSLCNAILEFREKYESD
jgi:N-acetylmuramoyl-L-alanine amidase